MAGVPGRLSVDSTGRVRGPVTITYNAPFPTREGTPGGSGTMRGVIMHTEVGFEAPTEAEFNSPSAHASAFFSIGMTGAVHQYGPVGKDWMAWAQVDGNPDWYSIEHEDHGDQHNPLTAEQIAASAQVVEVLSGFAGFPLQVTDSVNGTGYGVHVMGGAAWGGHTCPGPGPRAGQRAAIIALAKQIRAGTPPKPPAPAPVEEPDMILVQVDKASVPKDTSWPGVFLLDAGGLHHVTGPEGKVNNMESYQAAGIKGPVTITYGEYLARTGTPPAG